MSGGMLVDATKAAASGAFGRTFMFLTKLAWSSRFTLPMLITAAFIAMDFRMQVEINVHNARVAFEHHHNDHHHGHGHHHHHHHGVVFEEEDEMPDNEDMDELTISETSDVDDFDDGEDDADSWQTLDSDDEEEAEEGAEVGGIHNLLMELDVGVDIFRV